ncbi:MAG: NUDIX hydrolase [Myxococcales bacterium]|nr:NUDIX hydrolase [Myxococcales bacterium]
MTDEREGWFRQLRAISQYGLHYSKDPYDLERFRQVSAIASEIAARITGLPAAEVDARLALETGPPCPKLDVRAAVFREDRVLMVRETSDGLWTLPGGWVDVGESPATAAVREVREESGYECRATKLVAVIDRDRRGYPRMLLHAYKLLFLCELLGGAPATSIETSAAEFFPLGELPALSRGRVSAEEVALAFRHRDHPELPTEFE